MWKPFTSQDSKEAKRTRGAEQAPFVFKGEEVGGSKRPGPYSLSPLETVKRLTMNPTEAMGAGDPGRGVGGKVVGLSPAGFYSKTLPAGDGHGARLPQERGFSPK